MIKKSRYGEKDIMHMHTLFSSCLVAPLQSCSAVHYRWRLSLVPKCFKGISAVFGCSLSLRQDLEARSLIQPGKLTFPPISQPLSPQKSQRVMSTPTVWLWTWTWRVSAVCEVMLWMAVNKWSKLDTTGKHPGVSLKTPIFWPLVTKIQLM